MEFFLKNISTKIFEKLGPGYSERVYHNAFEVELRLRGIPYETEKILPVIYEGHTVGNLRADLIVDGRTIVELKSTTKLKDEFRNQVRNYIRLTGLESGYLVNFPCVAGDVEVECVVPSAAEGCLPPWLR
jgi:GxxExxY protein